MPKAYGYIRFSTQFQGALSVESQRESIRKLWSEHLQEEYPEIEFIEDRAISAKATLFSERPQGKKLCMLLEKGDAIVFAKLDRGFRNLLDALTMFHRWDALGVRVCCTDFGLSKHGIPYYDSRNWICKLGLIFWGLAAEMEAERHRQRRLDFEVSQKAQGRPSAHRPYMGFCYVRRGNPTGVKKQPPAWIQPNDAEQKVVRWLVEQRDKGFAFNVLVDHLNAHGYKTRYNCKIKQYNLVRWYQTWKPIIEKEKTLTLKPWEFLTYDGVVAVRFDKEHLIPKEIFDAVVPPLSRPHANAHAPARS